MSPIDIPEMTESKSENKPKKNNKKIVITAICICLSIIVLYFAIPSIFGLFESKETPVERKYNFWPVEENIDITADEKYMAKDRSFYFCDTNLNVTTSFNPDSLSEVPETYKLPVSCLVTYIRHAMNGEVEELNGMFSDVYFAEGFSKKDEFTPQKIYEITFTFYDQDTVEEELGTWDRFRFWVEYKIYKNNGTFRNDMESDCTRKEFFVVTYRDGKMQIDGITPYKLSK